MKPSNHITLEIESMPENVSLTRVVAAAFLSPLDPDVTELTDVKTAISEAVTNAIIHGYENENPENRVRMSLTLQDRLLTVVVSDKGVGIPDIPEAREPLFTTKPELERSGLGFTVMESFMDTVDVTSTPGEGTTITLTKTLATHG